MATDVPLPLPFHPMPSGERHYIVVLQNRKGEHDALAHASDETLDRLTPLFVFRPRGNQKQPLGTSTPSTWTRNLAQLVKGRPCFLDVEGLQRRGVKGQPKKTSAAEVFLHIAEKRRLPFVPVLPTTSQKKHTEIVTDATHRCGRGIALRHRFMAQVASPSQHAGRLRKLVSEIGVDIRHVDLLLDAEYFPPDTDVASTAVSDIVKAVSELGAWRNLALLGTSIPATMGSVAEGSLGSIARAEWQLWQALRDAKLQRIPAFGDYAVQHPRRPSSTGMGMRANIRYTTTGHTFVARGQGPTIQNGPSEYRDLCVRLYRHPDFAGGEYTWGDRVIEQVALGHMPPKSGQDQWRGVGTSHHLRFVVDQLA